MRTSPILTQIEKWLTRKKHSRIGACNVQMIQACSDSPLVLSSSNNILTSPTTGKSRLSVEPKHPIQGSIHLPMTIKWTHCHN